MKKVLFSFLFLFGFVYSATAATQEEVQEFLTHFYGSIAQGCIAALEKNEASSNYCNCAATSFKKQFTKADEEKLIKFAESVVSKPAEDQMQLMVEYVGSSEMQEKMANSAMECIHFIMEDKK